MLHSAASIGEPLGPDLSPAVSLAADNERLVASVRHEVLELRASRARIVETGDAERRRLERDLHDGASSGCSASSTTLLSRTMWPRRPGTRGRPRSAEAVAAADETIDALRTLARGIHPAILEEAGLAAALETLADDAPIPITVSQMLDTRYAPAIEAAAWRFVTDSVGDAARAGASATRI